MDSINDGVIKEINAFKKDLRSGDQRFNLLKDIEKRLKQTRERESHYSKTYKQNRKMADAFLSRISHLYDAIDCWPKQPGNQEISDKNCEMCVAHRAPHW